MCENASPDVRVLDPVADISGLLAHFRAQEPDYAEKAVWAWIPDNSEFGKHSDVARGYVVVTVDQGGAGVMLFGLYGAEWQPNPWSSRPVIKRLLGLCSGEVQSLLTT